MLTPKVNPGVVDMYNVTAAPIAFVQCMLQRGDAAPVLLVQSEGEGWRVSASDTLHRGLCK